MKYTLWKNARDAREDAMPDLMRLQQLISIIFLLIASVGCKPEDEKSSAETDTDSTDTDGSDVNDNMLYEICGDDVTTGSMNDFFTGNCVFGTTFSENGYSSGKLVAQLFFGVVLNGIDFSNLPAYTYDFDRSTGQYLLGDGNSHVGFTLYYDKDGENYRKGDIIPCSIFEVDCFVTDVDFAFTSSLELKPVFEEGPLYDLVQGDATFSLTNITDYSVKVKIDPTAVAIVIDSEQTFSGVEWGYPNDYLTVTMATSILSLANFAQQLDAGGVSVAYSGTEYHSEFFGIDQVFNDAVFIIRHQGNAWYWEGNYYSDVSRYGMTLYQSGFISNISQCYTEYYCDSERQTQIGTAWHDLEEAGGRFEFVNGEYFLYGLQRIH